MKVNTFQIDARSLEDRRARCREIVSQLSTLSKERLSGCPICDSENILVLAETDRYGLPFQSALCLECGHLFQIDRFDREGFAVFYRDYYRPLVSAFKGKAEGDLERLQEKQRVYGQSVLARTSSHLERVDVRRILDVGGSSGVIAALFTEHYDAVATVLDPAPDELALAADRFETISSTAEEWVVGEARFDVILLCNVFEHLRDIRGAFDNFRQALAPGGVMIVDIADFAVAASQEGPPECIAKVDHCHWLTLTTYREIFARLGFESCGAFVGRLPEQIGFVVRAAEIAPSEANREAALRIAQHLVAVRSEWLAFSRDSGQSALASILKRKTS